MQITSPNGRMIETDRIVNDLRNIQAKILIRINRVNDTERVSLQLEEAAIADAIAAIESLAGMVK